MPIIAMFLFFSYRGKGSEDKAGSVEPISSYQTRLSVPWWASECSARETLMLLVLALRRKALSLRPAPLSPVLMDRNFYSWKFFLGPHWSCHCLSCPIFTFKLVESVRIIRIDSSHSESLLILAYPNSPSHSPGLTSRASLIGPGMQASRE